jgi:hypothetical protein
MGCAIPLKHAIKSFDAATSENKKLKIFWIDEGGAETCQLDNRAFGADCIADWFADLFGRTLARRRRLRRRSQAAAGKKGVGEAIANTGADASTRIARAGSRCDDLLSSSNVLGQRQRSFSL